VTKEQGSGLAVTGLTKRFGGVTAAQQVDLAVVPGEIVGLIGPNGAGKSTVINCLTGVESPDAGRIDLNGTDIAGMSASGVVRLGLARTFQLPRSFQSMTVAETLATAALIRGDLMSARREAKHIATKIGLLSVLDRPSSELSLANRRKLELGRALATAPQVLLLDEVMAGLAEDEAEMLIEVVEEVASEGVGVLLVEHLIWVVSRLCHRLVVLNVGAIVATGPTRNVLRDPIVVEAYLGQPIA
jgi:branched-chain amino acid transport system ATP-binding protein